VAADGDCDTVAGSWWTDYLDSGAVGQARRKERLLAVEPLVTGGSDLAS
jgi:hypothetical protein